ncbi:hypothetical protein A2U01_0100307 [Trifolium medium]|uniref:Uncharacterized protein n=1 Tax=Trifolium medium TaxID=97028 RepID=A0A392USU1_9FABA|nr:hypothetical protein [Trifolium medium]
MQETEFAAAGARRSLSWHEAPGFCCKIEFVLVVARSAGLWARGARA